jgi:integrase
LTAENVNWQTRVFSYQRMKTGQWAFLRIGSSLEVLLRKLPSQGFLFPRIATLSDNDRSAEFSRRCRLLGINGITLHSYRYAWAQRAYQQGYQERFAQAALGHKSSAVHHAYARNAIVVCPPLENVETKIIPLTQAEPTEKEPERKIG